MDKETRTNISPIRSPRALTERHHRARSTQDDSLHVRALLALEERPAYYFATPTSRVKVFRALRERISYALHVAKSGLMTWKKGA